MDVADPETTLREVAPGAEARRLRAVLDRASDGEHAAAEVGRRRRGSTGGAGHRRLLRRGPGDRDLDVRLGAGGVASRHRPFTIVYARRTFTGWFNAFVEAGLEVEAIDEPCADEETAKRIPRSRIHGSFRTSSFFGPAKDRSHDSRTRRHPRLHRIGEAAARGDDLARGSRSPGAVVSRLVAHRVAVAPRSSPAVLVEHRVRGRRRSRIPSRVAGPV